MTLRTLYRYASALTRPVTTYPETVLSMPSVGADSIRPNVTEQSRWVNEIASNIVPFTAPLSSMRERADSMYSAITSFTNCAITWFTTLLYSSHPKKKMKW